LNTAVLKRAGEHGGPIVLTAGATSLLMALLAFSRGSPVAAGPAPTVTATVTAPAPVAARTVTPAPSTSGPTPAPTLQSVSDRTEALPHTGSGSQSHADARPPSAANPSPVAAPCSGQVLTVRVLKRACLSVGK
jgi:hypothetical protein